MTTNRAALGRLQRVNPGAGSPLGGILGAETSRRRIATTIAVTLTAASLVACASSQTGPSVTATNETVIASSASPTSIESTPLPDNGELQLTVESIAIDYEPDMTAEEIGHEITERFDFWVNAACNDELVSRYLNTPDDLEAFARKVSEENAPIFREALFAGNANPETEDLVDFMSHGNLRILYGYLSTVKSDNAEEPYRETLTLSDAEILEQTSTNLDIVLRVNASNNLEAINGDLSSLERNDPHFFAEGETIYTLTLEVDDKNKLKITEVVIEEHRFDD